VDNEISAFRMHGGATTAALSQTCIFDGRRLTANRYGSAQIGFVRDDENLLILISLVGGFPRGGILLVSHVCLWRKYIKMFW
jgi:hypothetical protein